MRDLILIFGDQLDSQAEIVQQADSNKDLIWMAEVHEEATHVWSHKARIALFLSAMRHFREELLKQKLPLEYIELTSNNNHGSFEKQLKASIKKHQPKRLVFQRPGEYRVLDIIRKVAKETGTDWQMVEGDHFLCTPQEFASHAKDRKQLRMEYFYREMRHKHDILMDADQPIGGSWNYDSENRKSFSGTDTLPSLPHRFRSDAITKQVIQFVNEKFADHPGTLQQFDWPVTRKQAKVALRDFLTERLSNFGAYQDAMQEDAPFLFHSRLSAAMNLQLLTPLEVIKAAEKAYHEGRAPLNSVEGFIRQILGWREYVRGIYWKLMPDYASGNALQASENLPTFYWTADTEMNCLHQVIQQTLHHGYAHHIQRLMVTGLFALLLGVEPRQVHEWYLAVYVDAVEWVELPNTIGMSQYADGGIMASKPYVATGNYIHKMSNYCENCRFNPSHSIGDDACPFTTLYWDFLLRHQRKFENHPRMGLQVRNLKGKSEDEVKLIQEQAKQLKEAYCSQ